MELWNQLIEYMVNSDNGVMWLSVVVLVVCGLSLLFAFSRRAD